LLEQNPEPFKKNGEILYNAVENEMQKQAYGNWETVLNEALVRTAVIKYMKDHQFSEEEVEFEINKQLNRGFLWIEELLVELENYDRQRHKYPTLESYMPNLIKAYDTFASKINTYIEDFDQKRPKIVSIDEFKNGDQKVNHSIKKITINFDRPLLGKDHSINYGENQEALPDFKKIIYSKDKKSITIEWELYENKNYEFVLTGLAFKSPEGISINDYRIKFKTK